MSREKTYDANFTAGGLLFRDFNSVKTILTEDNFIELIQIESEKNSYLGIPRESSRKRVISEIKRRYKIVSKDFWSWYVSIPENEQKLALFYTCLKTYPIVLDFHLEVSLKKHRIGDELDAFAVQMRIDELIATNEDVGSWSEATLYKINSQYRSTLKECGLLKGTKLISPSDMSDSFFDYFDTIGENWFKELCFK